MKSIVNKIALLAASALVFGTAAFGQTQLKARVPFAFHTSMSSLPAGDYIVTRELTHSGAPVASVWNTAAKNKVFLPIAALSSTSDGKPAILFTCSDDGGCALAGIRTAGVTYTYKTGRKNSSDKPARVIAIALRPANAD